jgi:hypothetical protein
MVKNNVSFRNRKTVIALTATAATSILFVVSIATSGAIKGGVEEAHAQTGTTTS